MTAFQVGDRITVRSSRGKLPGTVVAVSEDGKEYRVALDHLKGSQFPESGGWLARALTPLAPLADREGA